MLAARALRARQLGQQLAPAAAEEACWWLQQARGAKAAAKKKAAPAKGKQQKGKQQPKKQKQKMESRPFDEKDPLMQKVIAMLVPGEQQQQQSSSSVAKQRQAAQGSSGASDLQEEAVARAKEFSRQRMREHAEWQRDLAVKLQLKRAALQALPPELREAARQEDLEPFPLTRHFLYDTPPDAYRD